MIATIVARIGGDILAIDQIGASRIRLCHGAKRNNQINSTAASLCLESNRDRDQPTYASSIGDKPLTATSDPCKLPE